MHTKKRLKVISPLWYLSFLVSCTFGSVGNKQEEAIILESLIQLVREIPGTFQPIIHSYDDQLDTNIQLFSVTSGSGGNSKTYSLEILPENSFLIIDRLEFRFNPPDAPFGSLPRSSPTSAKLMDSKNYGSAKTHTPFTIPLDLPPDDPYGKTYISGGGRIDSFMLRNSGGIGLGSVSRNPIGIISNAPQGILASTNLFLERWDLNVRITQTSGVILGSATRNLRISTRDYHQTILPRCKTEILQNQSTEWILGLNYSRLFRDFFRSGSRVELINRIFQETSAQPNQIISITDISGYYDLFFTNLRSDDAVILQESCLL